jgi:hypothetical protein
VSDGSRINNNPLTEPFHNHSGTKQQKTKDPEVLTFKNNQKQSISSIKAPTINKTNTSTNKWEE